MALGQLLNDHTRLPPVLASVVRGYLGQAIAADILTRGGIAVSAPMDSMGSLSLQTVPANTPVHIGPAGPHAPCISAVFAGMRFVQGQHGALSSGAHWLFDVAELSYLPQWQELPWAHERSIDGDSWLLHIPHTDSKRFQVIHTDPGQEGGRFETARCQPGLGPLLPQDMGQLAAGTRIVLAMSAKTPLGYIQHLFPATVLAPAQDAILSLRAAWAPAHGDAGFGEDFQMPERDFGEIVAHFSWPVRALSQPRQDPDTRLYEFTISVDGLDPRTCVLMHDARHPTPGRTETGEKETPQLTSAPLETGLDSPVPMDTSSLVLGKRKRNE